jgi:hypothetical protein
MDDQAYLIQTADRLLAALNNGDDNDDATKDYREIVSTLAQRVADHGGKHKGKLTLTFSFEADQKGVDVSMVSKLTIPPRPVLKERLFPAERGGLTAKDPARGTLFQGDDLGRRRAQGSN